MSNYQCMVCSDPVAPTTDAFPICTECASEIIVAQKELEAEFEQESNSPSGVNS
jgi:DNA-directed RNA polymerase subunit RPC12/RpoP